MNEILCLDGNLHQKRELWLLLANYGPLGLVWSSSSIWSRGFRSLIKSSLWYFFSFTLRGRAAVRRPSAVSHAPAICGGVTAGRTRMLVSGASCSWCARPSVSLSRRSSLLATAAAAASSLFQSPTAFSIRARRGLGGELSSFRLPSCRAAKQRQQQEGSVKKRAGGRRKSSEKPASREPLVEVVPSTSNLPVGQNSSFPLPKPPAGFVVDALGKVLLASSRRIATIVSNLSVAALSSFAPAKRCCVHF